HRGVATGVRFVTGHCRDGWWLELDWKSLADPATTLVVYMGLAHIEQITTRLVEAGLDATTPTMAIENGTQDGERSLRAPLGGLAEATRDAGFRSPVLFIIGPVVEVLHNPAPLPFAVTDRHAAWIERVLHA
ncbi:MAG TPA: uroporphyrinogen-III C-methyltransferase, partial [Rhodospirillales bacterium]|nr:uroporphyrinogen-III C-methyltransferase [Rhodospirillales bacterium]